MVAGSLLKTFHEVSSASTAPSNTSYRSADENLKIQAISELSLDYNAALDLGADVGWVPMNMGSLGKKTHGGTFLRDAPRSRESCNDYELLSSRPRDGQCEATICMGKWMKKGWMIQNVEGKLYLQKNSNYLPLKWLRDTLVVSFGLEEEGKVSYVRGASGKVKAKPGLVWRSRTPSRCRTSQDGMVLMSFLAG